MADPPGHWCLGGFFLVAFKNMVGNLWSNPRPMGERGASVEHVMHALQNAASCSSSGENWKVTGPDLDVDALTVVVAIEGEVVVVTVF